MPRETGDSSTDRSIVENQGRVVEKIYQEAASSCKRIDYKLLKMNEMAQKMTPASFRKNMLDEFAQSV